MDQTWNVRELPALEAIVEYFDDPDSGGVGLTRRRAAELASMDEDTFRRALVKLAKADPPFLNLVTVAEDLVPIRITGVTERALIATGQWPSPEGLVADLVESLEQAALAEQEPERKSKLRAAANILGGVAKDVAVGWAIGVIPHPWQRQLRSRARPEAA
jgi:hypothetical protein